MRAGLPCALVVLLSAAPARAEGDALRVSWAVDGAVTGAAAAGAVAAELLTDTWGPTACRWCTPPGLDASVRDALRWGDPGAAKTASDVLVLAVPAGMVLYDGLSGHAAGGLGRAGEDVLLIVEAVSVAALLTEGSKYAFARERPDALHGAGTGTRDDHLSFWSGHTAIAFSAAAAGGEVARLRGYAGWPWAYAAGFTGAALTGYLRIAADKHWLTDVLVGAAVGTGVGLAVPWLHRSAGEPGALRVVPLPGGLAVAGAL